MMMPTNLHILAWLNPHTLLLAGHLAYPYKNMYRNQSVKFSAQLIFFSVSDKSGEILFQNEFLNVQ